MTQTMREALSGAIFQLQVPLNIIRAALAVPVNGEGSGLRTALLQALESGDTAMESLRHALPHPVAEPVSHVNINELLHEVLRISTERLLASDILVDWRPAAVLPAVAGQANALRGVFKSLIDNAIQALNQSGRNERELLLGTRFDQQELLIEIADNGPGIAREERLKVFEPFHCGWTRPADHAGMGLTTAQEVVNEHNGSIEIDGDYLGGCRVFIRLPLDGMRGE
jgi:nitrogen fixation negative regulator NifL